jgi:hypothetical protein
MLKDLANNLLGNSTGGGFPVVGLNPQQIYGENLTIWYDFSDTNSLFTDTGFTTNVSTSGQIIKGVINKGSDKNYNLISVYPSAVSGSTNSVSLFQRNTYNSNKHSSQLSVTGGTVNAGLGSLESISGTSTSASTVSAYTQSGVFVCGPVSNTAPHIIGGFRQNKLIPYIIRPSVDNYIEFRIIFNASTTNTYIILKRTGQVNFFYTFTVDSNNNVYLNVNNTFITSFTLSTNIFPIIPTVSSTLGKFMTHYYDGAAQAIKGINTMRLLEYTSSFNSVLTENQISNLHQYYKTKYNI